jgi:uncharacterized protein (TIRG00374 family)
MLYKVRIDYVLLMIISNFLAILLFSMAWHVVINEIYRISFKDSFISSCICIFGNLIVPSASFSGEVMRINYFKKKYKVPIERVLATIAINRFQYSVTMLSFFIIGIVIAYYYGMQIFSLLIALIFVLIITIPLILLLFSARSLIIIVDKFFRIFFFLSKEKDKIGFIYDKVYEAVDQFNLTVAYIKKSKGMVLALLCMALQWLFNSITIYLAFLSINVSVNVGIIIFTYPIFAMLTVTPIGIPGNIGLIEASMIWLYSGFGINFLASLVAVFLTRTIVILMDLFIPLPMFIKYKKFVL